MSLPLILLLAFGLLATSMASHFRYGTMSWVPVPNRTNTIGISVQVAIRAGRYRPSSQVGNVFTATFENLNWAKGTYNTKRMGSLTVNSGGLFDGWIYASTYMEHTYSQAFIDSKSSWEILLSGCCRVGGMRANSRQYYTVGTKVNKAAFVGGLSGPKIDMFPILEIPRGQNSQLQLSGSSQVDGLISSGAMTLRWANAGEACRYWWSRCKNGANYGVSDFNQATGSATWDTRTLQCGDIVDPQCKTNRQYEGWCIKGVACPVQNIPSVKWCQNLCEQHSKARDRRKRCSYISYHASTKTCRLLRYKTRSRRKNGWTSCRMLSFSKYRKPCLYPMQVIVTVSLSHKISTTLFIFYQCPLLSF